MASAHRERVQSIERPNVHPTIQYAGKMSRSHGLALASSRASPTAPRSTTARKPSATTNATPGERDGDGDGDEDSSLHALIFA